MGSILLYLITLLCYLAWVHFLAGFLYVVGKAALTIPNLNPYGLQERKAYKGKEVPLSNTQISILREDPISLAWVKGPLLYDKNLLKL